LGAKADALFRFKPVWKWYKKLHTHRPEHGTDQEEWPDGSREKRSYWTHEPNIARSFYPEEGKPALLRAKRSAADFKRESTGDHYLRKPLASHHLEVYDGTCCSPRIMNMHEITTIINEYMKEHGPLQTALFIEEVSEKAFGNKYRIKAFANGTYIVEQFKERSRHEQR
jgi:hypothetical protein